MREQDRERQKREWENKERQAEEFRARDEQEQRRQQEGMQLRMQKQDEEMRRRQQENSLFMQAQQLNNMLDQQEMNNGGNPGGNGGNQGAGGRKNFNDNNDNRRNFDMMNQGESLFMVSNLQIRWCADKVSVNLQIHFLSDRQPWWKQLSTATAAASPRKSAGRKLDCPTQSLIEMIRIIWQEVIQGRHLWKMLQGSSSVCNWSENSYNDGCF